MLNVWRSFAATPAAFLRTTDWISALPLPSV
jgi:hypothetical protein